MLEGERSRDPEEGAHSCWFVLSSEVTPNGNAVGKMILKHGPLWYPIDWLWYVVLEMPVLQYAELDFLERRETFPHLWVSSLQTSKAKQIVSNSEISTHTQCDVYICKHD